MKLGWLVIAASVGYLALLFLIAYYGEQRAKKGKSLLRNPYLYALTLAVYCTAWTYYGSVGNAAESGLNFLTTYVGPTILAPIWWLIFRKIIRVSKVHRITTIADLISTRYGKSVSLGSIVAVLCVLGVIPYISIQLKAISDSFMLIANPDAIATGLDNMNKPMFMDYTFYITLGLTLFTIFYGTRNVDATVKQDGMVTAIAFESLLKLVAFLVVGIFITYFAFDGFEDIFKRASANPELSKLMTLDVSTGYSDWFWLNLLSMMAFMFLPRQFHVSIKENTSERHLDKAIWLFPLYLLVINIFVIPIAFGGKILFADAPQIIADTYVLAIPISYSKAGLAIFAYLGGFAAGTSMIIVSTIALSIMISNNLILPYLVANKWFTRNYRGNVQRLLLNIRRGSILAVLLLSYFYYSLVSTRFSIVSIGLISFVAVAQFAPSVLGGIFWKEGNKKGAQAGLIAGFSIWFITLVLPTMVQVGVLPGLIQDGKLFSFIPLEDGNAFGLAMNKIPAALFWSLSLNAFLYVVLSIYTRQTSKERNQAEIFVDIFKYSKEFESTIAWKGTAFVKDIKNLLLHFMGAKKTEETFRLFQTRYDVVLKEQERANSLLVNFSEGILAGLIGPASARILVSSTLKEEEISTKEVFDMLRETQQIVSVNKVLQEKSEELRKATEELKKSNEKLRKLDHLKDEFISTVTHEMRTPITSIRAFSEILQDNSDHITPEEREQFFDTIIKETERMDRLITQVLELEKFESGKQELYPEELEINDLIRESISATRKLIDKHNITLTLDLQEHDYHVIADRDRIIQVILNLLSNAIKFCDQQQGELLLSSYYIDEEVKVKVADNGRGVPEAIQESIFEVFYQVPDQNRKKPKGSGLGLSICQKIIEHHNGRIWVESEEGKGAIFAFTLPAIFKKREQKKEEAESEKSINSR